MRHVEVADSLPLVSVGYDARARVLELALEDGDVRRFVGVPNAVYAALMFSTDRWRFFREQIRHRYDPVEASAR